MILILFKYYKIIIFDIVFFYDYNNSIISSKPQRCLIIFNYYKIIKYLDNNL